MCVQKVCIRYRVSVSTLVIVISSTDSRNKESLRFSSSKYLLFNAMLFVVTTLTIDFLHGLGNAAASDIFFQWFAVALKVYLCAFLRGVIQHIATLEEEKVIKLVMISRPNFF